MYFHYLSQNQIILSSNIKVFRKSLDFSVTNRIFNYTGVHDLIQIDSSIYVTGQVSYVSYRQNTGNGIHRQ